VREIEACRPWLVTELELVRPRVVVGLGATATASLLGKEFRVAAARGHFFEPPHSPTVFVTIHPAAILRSGDKQTREAEFGQFVADLKKVVKRLDSGAEK
jgi:uracil-DNA glycosylase